MKRILFFAVLVALFAFEGCSQQQITPTAPKSTSDQTLAVPADIQRLIDQYALPDNAGLPAVSAAWQIPGGIDSVDTSYDIFAVTFLWGNLSTNATPPVTTTDWSGTLSVNGV